MEYTRKGIVVEYRSPEELIPYEKNARTHNSEIEFLCNSIKEHGFDVSHAIGVDKDGVIIYGHGRRLAAIKLGMKEVPVVVRDDLSDEQVQAYRLADNKVSDLSGWDFDKLDFELNDLRLKEVDMTKFGFDDISFLEWEDGDGDSELDDERSTVRDEEDAPVSYDILVRCRTKEEQKESFQDLVEMGFDCQTVD